MSESMSAIQEALSLVLQVSEEDADTILIPLLKKLVLSPQKLNNISIQRIKDLSVIELNKVPNDNKPLNDYYSLFDWEQNDERLKKLIKWIVENGREAQTYNTPIKGLRSKNHLSEACQKHLKMPFKDVRSTIITHKAIKLYNSGEMLKNIAFDLGYSSEKSFKRFFKNFNGKDITEF